MEQRPQSTLAKKFSNGTNGIARNQHFQSKFKRYPIITNPKELFFRRYKHLFSKETAYTQAIIAAGVVYSVTKNCSKGEIMGCGCDPERSGPLNVTKMKANLDDLEAKREVDWNWGGCSDNTEFGERVAKGIVKSMEQGNDVQAYAMLHNNLVGRKVGVFK